MDLCRFSIQLCGSAVKRTKINKIQNVSIQNPKTNH